MNDPPTTNPISGDPDAENQAPPRKTQSPRPQHCGGNRRGEGVSGEALSRLRMWAPRRVDAIRWACVLEATAPKVGNVFPGRLFRDLRYIDFVQAAEIAAEEFEQTDDRVTARVLETVRRTVQVIGTNVNLGILLLLGPLVAAEETLNQAGSEPASNAPQTAADRRFDSDHDWQMAVERVLSDLDPIDSRNLFLAIHAAHPGGLGDADVMDVRDEQADWSDIVAAMKLGRQRDRIALQYADNYRDFFTNVVPLVAASLRDAGDMLQGITVAQLRLLAAAPDSLIARKRGSEVAEQIRARAARVDVDEVLSVNEFDNSLRDPNNGLNPGTTADLIAAAIYVLLRLE